MRITLYYKEKVDCVWEEEAELGIFPVLIVIYGH